MDHRGEGEREKIGRGVTQGLILAERSIRKEGRWREVIKKWIIERDKRKE
jgi:hypothetical protein